jgi:drug/metabolite transporter (DMT)-like permease
MACITYLFQVTFTYSFFLLYPGFGTLLYKSGIIFSVLLAVGLFPDERTTLRDPKFQLGLILGLVGMVITIVGDKDFGKMQFNLGVVVVLTATASWSLLTALIKKWLPGVSPSFAVSVILTIVTPFFLLTDIIMSGGLRIPQTTPYMWTMMIISGILGVGIAHTSYYRSVPVLGVALCASIDLSRPLLVALISFFLYGERLTIPQMIGGILLIAGSYLVIKIRFGHIRSEP